MSKVLVFDTETIGTEKLFTYNIGFCILDTVTKDIVVKEDYVVEQIWDNKPLFETAYYASKKPIYVSLMRGRKAKKRKFGEVTQRMADLIRMFDIHSCYAYNSPFDKNVMDYNCTWFRCINPLDDVEIYDIRGLVHNFIAFEKEYQDFCEAHSLFTESGNFSTTAEAVYRFITKDKDFEEAHTALADSLIETAILVHCIDLGGKYDTAYKTYASIPRVIKKSLVIMKPDGTTVEMDYEKAIIYKTPTKIKIILREYKKKKGTKP